MSWRKYLRLEHRRQPRYSITVDVEFYVLDELMQKPLTEKGAGRLLTISVKGAHLQTNAVRIGNYHLMNDNLGGNTPLILEFPPFSEGTAWALKSKIIWYNKLSIGDQFKFEFGIEFLHVSTNERTRLESLTISIE